MLQSRNSLRYLDQCFIDGEWRTVTGTGAGLVINPATEEAVASVRFGSREDADVAVRAARRAFPEWSEAPLEARLEPIERLRRIYAERANELTAAIVAELGAPVAFAREHHVGFPAETIAANLELARGYAFEQEMGNSLIRREAYGVVAAITPWNDPVMLALIKLVPALAAGCTLVWKPPQLTSLSATLLAECLAAADFPRGVVNVVFGKGSEVGEVLAGHPEVDLIAFTGSTEAGKRVAELAVKNVAKLLLELGGKGANVVLPDANLTKAAEAGAKDCFLNSGQFCGALTRMLVHREQLDEAARIAAAYAETLVLGDPEDEMTTMGPVVSAEQRDKIVGYIRSGIEEGAQVAAGGPDQPANLHRGYYVAPTVLSGVRPDTKVAQEEIFGPVLAITPYDDEDQAIAIANGTIYGLRCAVWAGSEERAVQAARRIRAGQIDVNGYKFNIHAPFGGYKQSGIGRTLGRFGLEEFLQVKAIQS